MRKDLEERFNQISWAHITQSESRSGDGSSLKYTEKLRITLPKLLRSYNVKTFLDAPCGDWNWMRLVDLSGIAYIGMDIVEDIVTTNQEKFSTDSVRFVHGDITSDPLPTADLIMVRDCLFHLKNWMIIAFFKNFLDSGIPYLLVTTHHNTINHDLPEVGQFQRRNFQIAPFRFPEPKAYLPDTPDEGNFYPRGLALWTREDVQGVVDRVKVVPAR